MSQLGFDTGAILPIIQPCFTPLLLMEMVALLQMREISAGESSIAEAMESCRRDHLAAGRLDGLLTPGIDALDLTGNYGYVTHPEWPMECRLVGDLDDPFRKVNVLKFLCDEYSVASVRDASTRETLEASIMRMARVLSPSAIERMATRISPRPGKSVRISAVGAVAEDDLTFGRVAMDPSLAVRAREAAHLPEPQRLFGRSD